MIIATQKRKGNTFQDDLDKVCDMEDFTTSSIIGTLLLLPTEQIWDIFTKAANSSKDSSLLKEFVPTQIIKYDFWPSWKLNTARKEPDAFIRFKGRLNNKDSYLCLIIEAKRKGNSNQQNKDQWNSELKSFPYHDDERLLLAIGGNTNEQNKDVIQFSWEALLQAVKEEEASGKEINGTHVERIYTLLRTAFKIHDIRLYRFVKDIPNIEVDASGINAFIDLKNYVENEVRNELKKRN